MLLALALQTGWPLSELSALSLQELNGWLEVFMELKGKGQRMVSDAAPVDDPSTIELPEAVRKHLGGA